MYHRRLSYIQAVGRVGGGCGTRFPAKHKTPKYVRFVDVFPMNAAGKILKYKMVEEATELLGLGKASKIVTA